MPLQGRLDALAEPSVLPKLGGFAVCTPRFLREPRGRARGGRDRVRAGSNRRMTAAGGHHGSPNSSSTRIWPFAVFTEWSC